MVEVDPMDGPRFDAWTRLLARGMPRRPVLRLLAGAVLGGTATRIGLRSAAADTMGCVDFGLPCSIGECCHGYTCVAGYPTSVCGYCLDASAFCQDSSECCSGVCEFSLLRLWWVCKNPSSRHKKHKKKKGKGKRD
jgi:hypothetical protein